MKKIFLLLLIGASALTSCEREDCSPDEVTSTFAENKTIAIHYNKEAQRNYFLVEDGENIVFKYNYTRAQCENILDDEWGYSFTFEVDKAASQFRFEGSELATAKGVYMEYGAWVAGFDQEIESGLIEGTRISANRWRVKVAVTTKPQSSEEQAKQVAFERVFEK